jgi:subfamily B ATP-binding cassette protein MsbA
MMFNRHKESKGCNVPTGKRKRSTLRRLLGYALGVWHLLVSLGICILATSLLDLAGPWIIGFLLVDRVIKQHDPNRLPLVMILISSAFLGQQVFEFGQDYFQQLANQRVLNKLRCDLYAHAMELPVRFFDRGQTGELLSRVTGDVDTVEGFLDTLMQDVGSQVITLVGTLSFLFAVSVKLTLYIVPTVMALAASVFLFKKTVKKGSRRVRDILGAMNGLASEALSGVRTVKTFCAEKFEVERFAKQSAELLGARVRATKLSSVYSSTVEFCAFLGTLTVIFVATPWALGGTFTIGALYAYFSYLNKLYSPVKKLSKVNLSIQKILTAGDRVFEIMDVAPETMSSLQTTSSYQPGPPAKSLVPRFFLGSIDFRHVTFGYDPARPILKDFSLRVEPGEMVALVGPSGGGKTTIVNLLLRFYEPTAGHILLDGVPIGQIPIGVLRKQIGVVPQETFLFSGTSLDNIAYAQPEATEPKIRAAARAANAHDFISKSPEGYQLQVGERGVQLSGGQRQRIAIARALLRNPRIMVFDEATSHLDSESEQLIQQALKMVALGRTVLVIAHRLSSIRRADKIVVIEEGEIAQIGTHDELLACEGRYRKLLTPQVHTRSCYFSPMERGDRK